MATTYKIQWEDRYSTGTINGLPLSSKPDFGFDYAYVSYNMGETNEVLDEVGQGNREMTEDEAAAIESVAADILFTAETDKKTADDAASDLQAEINEQQKAIKESNAALLAANEAAIEAANAIVAKVEGEVDAGASNTEEAEQLRILGTTDWYVTRKAETGEDIPQDILDQRAAAREALSALRS